MTGEVDGLAVLGDRGHSMARQALHPVAGRAVHRIRVVGRVQKVDGIRIIQVDRAGNLGTNERRRNVAGAFLCTPTFATRALEGRTILVIDDVSTTGATLEACAAPLFAAGAASVWGLVLARPV